MTRPRRTERLWTAADPELRERVQRAAAAEDRSTSSFLRLALLERLARLDGGRVA
jgi:predicted transcriptional regulator